MKKWIQVLISVLLLLLLPEGSVFAQIPSILGPTNTPLSSGQPDRIIAVFKNKPNTRMLLSVAATNQNVELEQGLPGTNAVVYKVKDADMSLAITSLKQNQQVAAAFSDISFVPLVLPNDPFIQATPIPGRPRLQWNMFNLKLADPGNSAWNVTTGSSDVVVAVIDSGVDSSHPDLAGKLSSMVDCAKDSCSEVSSMVDSALAGAHGTHVAGLVAAATNNGVGMAAAGYNSKMMMIKVMDADGDMWLSYITNAIRWSADHQAKVINLSLGTVQDNLDQEKINFINDAVAYAWNKGVVVVAAAGNCGDSSQNSEACRISGTDQYARNSRFYPAASPNVISVAALAVDNSMASYSEHNDSSVPGIGNWISVTAPGGDCAGSSAYNCIASAYPPSFITQPPQPTPQILPYIYKAGTSMASPQVAGITALVFAANPALNNIQVKNIIETTANHSVATDISNNGLVDALAAVNAAGNSGPTATPEPSATPGGPSPTVAPSATAAPSPTISPTSAPTLTPIPTNPPKLPKSTTLPPSGPYCPQTIIGQSGTCPLKSSGDANCDGVVNEADYVFWGQQFDTWHDVNQINEDANFACVEGNSTTYYIDMVDFEVWRKNLQN